MIVLATLMYRELLLKVLSVYECLVLAIGAEMLSTNTESHPTHIALTPHGGPEEDSVQPASRTFQENFDLANIAVRETPSRASPEPITDLQGQYVGPASGLSFLARVRKRLHHGDHTPSSFTFGDAPMEEYDPTPSIMISTEDSARLLEKFFDFTIPIDRIVHRPTVEEWLEQFQQTMGAMRDTIYAPAQRAILWMIFSMAQEHMIHSVPGRGKDRSIQYFLAADYQLSKERGTVNLASVQARLYQCFWLLSRSRVNHCWGLFGTAARLALALGLHRKQFKSRDRLSDHIDLECRRRTFWSAYCLDVHLSLTLGRPKIFHDEDIDQELPSDADDMNLRANLLTPAAAYGLHRILSLILRDLYSIRFVSTIDQCTLAAHYSTMLQQWRDDLPGSLRMDLGNSTPFIPIFQRQRDVLNYTYWHAVILTNRPLLLKGFNTSEDDGTRIAFEKYKAKIQDGVDKCLQAALSVTNRVCQMFQGGLMFRSFWGTCYYGFTASAVLFVYTIQQASSPAEVYHQYFDAATRCQNNLATFRENSSLVERYILVLEELQQEAIRQIERQSSPSDWSMPTSQMEGIASEYANILGVRIPLSAAGYEDMISAPADIATWMQFESLDVPSFTGLNPITRH
ncbi:hypothetical protein TCE0_050f18290 [Talaromyces pinophilus]|uniref:Xylanolytic transcriptional activator regulatory domain-containing protein n=1 Tax=Talaromyces pinophilus TaxID=128442 RepID=A0A0B8N7D2_TALPI|nr:hypothetical protein TCE0_050f18290 [Talaromyces pinophilus]